MVDVNPNASTLQAQLQAQLRGSRDAANLARGSNGLRPRPQDVTEEQVRDRQGQPSQQDRRLPAKIDSRVEDLSSARDLEAARARVRAVAGGSSNREAPIGRTSTRQNELRNQPLGQIIDIRV